MGVWVLAANLQARRFYEALGGRVVHSAPDDIGGRTYELVAYGYQLEDRD